ncbi:NADH:ubiquinone oxidoreductase subunit F (NADH-binding) [Nocardioides sp. BE266]|uniref:NADH-ubiquinone oxidoreductase-F iron-sulfur binding region domain-containing protein n=1 Tax=Nocardioides sp. BE266 TaxID=2817725 RepID=UPI002863CECF|nr:NADH-ubiquinone oxidoreductase-F iron-sulfur binding region domain-containing protein [Nocardioides sp. BE266]MDR7253525.1 NADH:ubiquinone oxidoreductase subunit F (NADH-binding) [Nocardioides sp. BE266]
MTSTLAARSPVPLPDDITVLPGPALLAGLTRGPSLAAHRHQFGALPWIGLDVLQDLVGRVGVRGRGGAAFPFATKLETVARRRRPVVVVNFAEGEPASAKDMALALTRPHLVLDGAVAAARALGAREIHVVLPGERVRVQAAMHLASEERDDRMRIRVHTTTHGFVSGQSRAVIELMSGRPNLPVTAWEPEALSGFAGRPTLLSNAETWAQVGLLALGGASSYRRLGTQVEPGSTLVTLTRTGSATTPEVHEVAFGTPWSEVIRPLAPRTEVLVGGFHGSWTRWETLSSMRVSPTEMLAAGIPLGAGVVHVADAATCPLAFTADVAAYLAGESAGRCGPCVNGLPAIARELRAVVGGHGDPARLSRLTGLVTGRGACAHPDGTSRLVRTALTTLADEVEAHLHGRCGRALDADGRAS